MVLRSAGRVALRIVSWGTRCLVSLALTVVATVIGCGTVTDLNALCYGHQAHQRFSQLLEPIPGQISSLLILVLPAAICWLYMTDEEPEGRCARRLDAWLRSGMAAFAAGLMLGVLAGPPPGPYAHFQDVDLSHEVNNPLASRAAVDKVDL
mmetsp:Transcript_52024/g.97321  ORF Transcript_52024/g.97321 Transcript_52024/m.97321 type:complete len:151 (-) Transcript_52024:42-494(-)